MVIFGITLANPLSDLYSDDGKTIKVKSNNQKLIEECKKEELKFKEFYNKNTLLINYISQYKKLLDLLKLPYFTDINKILYNIKELSIPETEKLKLCFTITDILNNIVLNLEEIGVIGARSYITWNIDKFIKYLPANIKITE